MLRAGDVMSFFFFFFSYKNVGVVEVGSNFLIGLYILASEHVLTRVLRGSSIFWVRVNLEHLLYLGLLHFSITKKNLGV